MHIHAKSPCRVDLAGGTLDIWPLYLFHENAVTVNFAVDRYTSCEIATRDDRKIVIRSADQNAEEIFDNLDALRSARKYKLPLLAYIVRFFRPEMGIELSTNSEAPAGAGISGSSSLLISTGSALNLLTNSGYGIEKIREIAQNVEAQIIHVPTGCQDYYPAMYGGVSAIDLTPAGIQHHTLPVDLQDFDSRIVLAYSGKPRNSGINNWEVTKAHIDGDKTVFKNIERIAAIAHALRTALVKPDWDEVARLIREEWANRRKNAPGITTEFIDTLIATAKRAGGKAAKVCGAGGGGCVFFLVEPGSKAAVQESLRKQGAEILDVKVAPQGVRAVSTTAKASR
jgi:D-glycero-alpha-D-manno-heptose-7-phosphate kinase